MTTIHLDLSALQKPRNPNHWLVAPLGFSAAKPDQTAPEFDQTEERLARAWLAVIESQPRTVILGISDDGLQVEAQQRSAAFGFIDRISARVLSLASGRSTLIAYSRSLVGYWDLGVNRRRLGRWLSALKEQVETTSG